MSAIELLSQLVYLASVVVSVRLWLRTRTRQAAWVAATFGVLGAVILVGMVLGEDGQLPFPLDRVFIVVVLLIPWLLFRFADTVVGAGPRLRQVMDVLGLGAALSALVVALPPPDVEPEGLVAAWVLFIVGVWFLLAVVTTVLLWRAGTGAPGVTRGRVRLLALGSLLLGFAILVSAGPGGEETTQAISQVFSMLAAFTFLAGFAPPALLRQAWRADDERALYQTSVGLLSATDEAAISAVMLPGLRTMLGSDGIVALDDAGRALNTDGDLVDLDDPDTQRVEVGPMHLAYVPSSAMPLFGAGEQELLDRLGLLSSLALERVRFVEAERRAKAAAEEANEALSQANLDLEAVNNELEAFVYTTSHDLKNPVIAILGYVEVLEEDYADHLPEDAKYYLERMSVNAAFMQSLIRDLLELSRVGRMETEPSRVGLNGVLAAIAGDASRRHDGVELQMNWEPEQPDLWINPTRLRQLLENLVENACRYAGRQDVVVEVATLVHPEGLRLDVRDNGVGIPVDQTERVFGMFERLDPDAGDGTGMGLAICRRIVESVGGNIFVVPSPTGAHFRIDLPSEVLLPPEPPGPDRATPDTTDAPDPASYRPETDPTDDQTRMTA